MKQKKEHAEILTKRKVNKKKLKFNYNFLYHAGLGKGVKDSDDMPHGMYRESRMFTKKAKPLKKKRLLRRNMKKTIGFKKREKKSPTNMTLDKKKWFFGY